SRDWSSDVCSSDLEVPSASSVPFGQERTACGLAVSRQWRDAEYPSVGEPCGERHGFVCHVRSRRVGLDSNCELYRPAISSGWAVNKSSPVLWVAQSALVNHVSSESSAFARRACIR